MKTGQVILLLAICVVAYIDLTRDEEKGVGEGPRPDYSDGYPGFQNQGFCSNPKAVNWNPLAPVNNSRSEMLVTCAGLEEENVFYDFVEGGLGMQVEQTHDRLRNQLSICTTDLTGQSVVARTSQGYPHGGPLDGDFPGNFDTMSYCLPGEWFLTQITKSALLVAPEGTFPDGLQSASSYNLHEFAVLPHNISIMGPLQEGQDVSILKLRPDTTYQIQDLIDYLWTPRTANKYGFGEANEMVHAHPGHEEFVNRLETWRSNPLEAVESKKYRRVGDPSFFHPVDFDLDNSGNVVRANQYSAGAQFQFLTKEKQAFLQFYNAYSNDSFPIDVSQVERRYSKIAAILDADKDGFIDGEDFRIYAETTMLGQSYPMGTDGVGLQDDIEEFGLVPVGEHISGYDQPYHSAGVTSWYGDPDIPVVQMSDEDGPIDEQYLGFSAQWLYTLFGETKGLEECYNLRIPLHPYMNEEGEAWPIDSGCEAIFGKGESSNTISKSGLTHIPKDRWVEVLYATDGMACGDDTGQVLCFPFSTSEKLAAGDEYLTKIRPTLGITDPEIDWETGEVLSWTQPDPQEFNEFRFQENYTLDGTTAINFDGEMIEPREEEFRVKLKSNTQCPASHPNFHRFCLTRRTLPSLIGPEDQIEPVYGVDETTETT